MKKQAKGNEEMEPANGEVMDGGPLPGEVTIKADPEVTSSGLKFTPVPVSEDKYQQGFFRFDADGVSFTGKFVRLWAPGEHENLEHAAIEMTSYPDGAPWLLPGNTQLWEMFIHHMDSRVDFANTVYRITRVEQVLNPKDGKVKFVRFRTEVASL